MLNKADQYLRIVEDRGTKGLELKRVYRNIRQPGLFVKAYGKIYSNKGALTPGVDPEDTIQNMSLDRIEKIIAELEKGTYVWKPVQRRYIPKGNGDRRPLGLPSGNDKLLQQVIAYVLNAYYEPQFSKYSHGFRPERGCHTALSEIQRVWKGTKWFIEGDIRKCFDHIDHEILIEIMGKDIKDNRFLKLIRQMLKAGYMEDWQYHETYSGTPQGGIVSPILANIYLNELDKFVENELIPKYTTGKARADNLEYRGYLNWKNRAKRKGDMEEYQAAEKLMFATPSKDAMDPAYRRLRYCRYADDFILGYTGPKSDALQIKEEIKEFLKTIKLDLSDEKTLITNAKNHRARFLGYELNAAQENSRRSKQGKRSINGRIMLSVPNKVISRTKNKFNKNNKTVHRPELVNLRDYDIVKSYEVELNGIVNYYKLAVNVAQLYQAKVTYMTSLAKTLAHKHKCRVSSIYSRYGCTFENGLVGLRAILPRKDKEPLVATFGGKPIRRNKAIQLGDQIQRYFPYTFEASRRLISNECEACGKIGPVQSHHINHLQKWRDKYGKKDIPWWLETMIKMNRKTLFVCQECHTKIHAGTYDGPKL